MIVHAPDVLLQVDRFQKVFHGMQFADAEICGHSSYYRFWPVACNNSKTPDKRQNSAQSICNLAASPYNQCIVRQDRENA